MTTAIAISIDRILEGVYAHSAAESIIGDADRPEILGRDHKPMLRVLCRETLAAIALSMGQSLAGSNLAEDPMPDIITLDLYLPQFMVPDMLRAAIETAMAAGVLAKAWSGSKSPIYERYNEAWRITCATVKNLLATGPLPGAIKPTA